MIRSCLIVLLLCICIVRCQYDNICASPTILQLDSATFELNSNGDTLVFPGGTGVRANFVNQRQGALKFYSQVGFLDNSAICEGLVAFNFGTLTAVLDDGSDLNYYDLVFDFFINKKRSVESPFFYSLSQVEKASEANVFSFIGRSNYFFSGNSAIICVDSSCTDSQIVNVKGEIVSAIEETESLLVLSVDAGNLILSQIKDFEVQRTNLINLEGNAQASWSFLNTESFIGLLRDGDNDDLVIVDADASVTKIDTVGEASLKVVRRKEFNFVALQSESSFTTYVCKSSKCRKVTTSPMVNEIWDFDMSRNGESVIAFADRDEITVVSCSKFDCRELTTSTIKAPGVVASLKVSYNYQPTIVFSLENGATAIVNCLDSACSSVSLSRASDYLSSSNFAFIQDSEEFIIYANQKIQSYNNHFATPHAELCRETIAGNHGIEDGEVFVCNALPVIENYSQIFFWAPVVTSVFSQNL